MELNNYLQRNGCANSLDIKVSPEGPAHRPQWNAVAYCKSAPHKPPPILISKILAVNGIKYGQARKHTQQDALDEAARLTLELMYHQRGGHF